MNLLVLVGLLHLAQSIYSIPMDDHRYECMLKWNNLRYDFAEEYGIANMNQLVYDVSLEQDLEAEVEKHEETTTSIYTKNSTIFWINEKHQDERITHLLEMRVLSEAGSTKMGCAMTERQGTSQMHVAIDVSQSPLYGGPPATKCPADRVASEKWEKLCALDGSRRGKYQRKRCGLLGCTAIKIEETWDKWFG